MYRTFFSLLVVGTLSAASGTGSSNINPAHRFSWGENIGWINWQHDTPLAGDGVLVDVDHLAGFTWAENVGWINLGNGGGPYANDPEDSATFGINVDPSTGDLYGLAWGENIGWVNFDTTAALGQDRARFDNCNRRFVGYVWAENIGWINLNDATHFVAVGPCVAGDLDCDGEVTLDDFAGFALSLSGPDVTTACSAFDVDGDNDVDLADYAEMQRVLTAAP